MEFSGRVETFPGQNSNAKSYLNMATYYRVILDKSGGQISLRHVFDDDILYGVGILSKRQIKFGAKF